MVWAQAVDAVEVLRYNGRASGKGGGQVLRQLKYFQSVVRLCSFSQATEENDLSQSAISQQMQALERGSRQDLCAKLFAGSGGMKSADNGDVVQSRLQVLHVHVLPAAPLGTCHCTIFSDIVCCLLSNVCVVTSFCQSLQAMSPFLLFSICATYCTLSGQNIRLN